MQNLLDSRAMLSEALERAEANAAFNMIGDTLDVIDEIDEAIRLHAKGYRHYRHFRALGA